MLYSRWLSSPRSALVISQVLGYGYGLRLRLDEVRVLKTLTA